MEVSKANEERDLGVTIQDLLPEMHINKIVGVTYRLLKNMDEEMRRELIPSILRPRLEYVAVVWSPQLKKIRETKKDT